MPLAEKIVAALDGRDERVLDVRIGLGCTVFRGMRPIAGRPAAELLQLLSSADPIEAAVGLACANALANRPAEEFVDGDVLEQLDLSSEDHVGMVGNFGPLVGPVRKKAGRLTIFEQVEEPTGDMLPAAEAVRVLPECQVALITATTIINHSVDELLAASGNCRMVVVLGASTPLLPEVFAGTPVGLISGVVVTDPEAVLRIVSEGGGMRFFKPHIRKVNLPLREMGNQP
jgi:uncharacterized protein (DUF4213/DUF364 family)